MSPDVSGFPALIDLGLGGVNAALLLGIFLRLGHLQAANAAVRDRLSRLELSFDKKEQPA